MALIKTPNPKLRMIAGPNGSGKSTLLNYLRTNFRFPLGYCLNPDELEQQIRAYRQLYLGWQAGTEESELHAFMRAHPLGGKLDSKLPSLRDNMLIFGEDFTTDYFTVILCDFLRHKWMASGESFTFETVMSHRSKIDLLRAALNAGYRTYLYYVCTESVIINKARIANRFQLGGHDVSSHTVESRFDRSLGQLTDAIRHSNRAYIFDNSRETHRLIAEFSDGSVVQVSRDLPRWFIDSTWQQIQ